jgi:hypothetical protein
MNQCFSQGDWQAYLDREMPADELARAEAHLDQCGACAALHKEVAGRAERVALLMADLASAGEILRRPSPRPQTWRWAVPVVALAAALLVVWLLPRTPAPAVVRTATAPRIDTPAVGPVQRPLKRALRRVVRLRETPDPSLAGFIALDDDPIETAVIVRVTLDDGLAQADVIVGPDGRAHAIRMVPGNSGE